METGQGLHIRLLEWLDSTSPPRCLEAAIRNNDITVFDEATSARCFELSYRAMSALDILLRPEIFWHDATIHDLR